MKRCAALLLAILFLTGCQSMYPDDYLSVETHRVYYAYRETTTETEAPVETENPIKTVYHPAEIRTGIEEMLLNNERSGQFLLKNYFGRTENLSKTVEEDMILNSPKDRYALNYLDISQTETADGILLNVNLGPKLSPEEYQSILTKLYSNALPVIYKALDQYDDSLIIQITVYEETDFSQLLDDYILAHPDKVIETPEINVTVFPEDSGSVRVVDLQFRYRTDQETLKGRQKDVKALLASYLTLIQDSTDPQQLLEDLSMLLVPPRVYYKDTENANVYSLLLYKESNSRTMASVSAYFCNHTEYNCEIVTGERDGQSWYWNRIQTSPTDPWQYFDLHAAALSESAPSLLTAEEMAEIGYTWDAELYPEIEMIEPAESQETEAIEETVEGSTEPSPETP